MIETKLHTELVSLLETRIGEVILALKRGEEVKQLLIGETGLAGVVYESSYDYYIFDKKWTEEQFDDYWENGGEEKEIDNYIDGVVDNYDDDSTWEELNW
ncbi:hypothetical protein [Limosilactobacillus reuteri]|uniref:hypothetical protein n=1 Tax=Limosilactobacillus reuteri TaxID=1598 RepID=UPI002B05D735|nr:hypothetical protein [Limosilactobacillus reuteri]